MNLHRLKILGFWVALVASGVLLDNPDPSRLLLIGLFSACWVIHRFWVAPLYPESMRIQKGRGLMTWVDKSPTLSRWIPIYYFALAMFSVASMFLFPGVVGDYITTAPRIMAIIFFPFIVYLIKVHYDLYRSMGKERLSSS